MPDTADYDVKKARKLADALHIPFGYLFLPKRPTNDIKVPDLRTVGSKPITEFSPNMLDQLRHLLLKQEWYREYADEHGRKPIEFIGRFSVRSYYDGVARDIRENSASTRSFERLLIRGRNSSYSIQVGYDAEERHRSALLIRPTSPPITAQREHRSSYWHRRIARHTVIGLATIACVSLFWELFSIRVDVISRFSISTAYPALFLTAAAAIIGPWNVLRGRTNPVSFDLRRDLGIWAGILALLHTGVGLNVHLRGRPWLYFIDEHNHVRHDLFGIGNDTGLLAALVFLLLMAISNDLSLRRLGSKRWKSLQRWTYMAGALTLMHAVVYQLVEKRQSAYDALLWVTIAMTIVLQVAGWWRTKRNWNKGALVSPVRP